MDSRERDINETALQEKKLRDAARKRKHRKRVKAMITWLIVLIIIATLAYLFFVARPKAEEAKARLANATKTIETTVKESFYTEVIDLSGYVEPYDSLTAKFRSTGAVTGVFVKEGQSVKKGDLIASIDNTSQLQALKSIENQIEEAELNGSKKSLEILLLQKKNAENNLDYTNIYATFDGIVTDVEVNESDYFEAGDSVVTIIDRSRLKATVEIDEIDMQYINLGQEAVLTFDSMPGEEIRAKVTYIPMLARYTSQGIGVVDVELIIENPPERLLPGYTFEGTINVTGDQRMLIIPSAAVTTERGGVTSVTFKNPNGATEKREVKVKYLGEGQCQVLSGLRAGDTIMYELSTSIQTQGMGGGGGGPMGDRR